MRQNGRGEFSFKQNTFLFFCLRHTEVASISCLMRNCMRYENRVDRQTD